MQIVDNFLPTIYFNKLINIFEHGNEAMGNKFPWFWNDNTAYNDNNFMFSHMVWDITLGKISAYFEALDPIVYFLDKYSPVEELSRMKLNLYTNQNKKILHAKHLDMIDNEDRPLPNITVCILNFTDCNGGTIIDDKDYPSKANQALIFSNDLFHQGYAQTDKTKRIMLNIATTNKINA